MGCSPWGREESGTIERLHFHALEKEMAKHSSVLARRIPGTGGAWWAAIYGVTQSRTRLKRLSSSSKQHDVSCELVMCIALFILSILTLLCFYHKCWIFSSAFSAV